MSGERNRALELIEKIPKDSEHYLRSRLNIPGLEYEEFLEIVRKLKEGNYEHGCTTVTAGRNTVINGFWQNIRRTGRLQKSPVWHRQRPISM